MSQGVDLYDIIDSISQHVKQMGSYAINALPDMSHGSIDMLYNGQEAHVIEINSSANIYLHMFPTEGKPRNVMASIIDYYFPETIDKKGLHNNMYFDYLAIIDVLKKNYTNYIHVKPLPNAKIKSKKYYITGNMNYTTYSNWIRRHVTDNDLCGFID